MRKTAALIAVMLMVGLAPLSSRANCATWKEMEVQSANDDTDVKPWFDPALIGCADGRAEIADTQYLSPAATALMVVVKTPLVNHPRAAPTEGRVDFDAGSDRDLTFDFDGLWYSNVVTIPSAATRVTVTACIVNSGFDGCHTRSITYKRSF